MLSGELPIMESAYTEGTKSLIIMRVDFPDYTGERVSFTTLSNLVQSMNTFWRDMSYDKAGWASVGSGSDVTPTLRLPLDSSNYESLGRCARRHVRRPRRRVTIWATTSSTWW